LSVLEATDQTAAVTAALEAINEQWSWDAGLRQSVHNRYTELLALSPGKAKPDLGPIPQPIKGPALDRFNPYGKFDPYFLVDAYGRDQLRAVLVRGTQRDLRDAVAFVKERHPGTKPTSASRKDDMIDYIMEYVAGPGY
jgi:hypothetical protein